MIYVESLDEKNDNVKDSDLMIIEDNEDTKKITIENLRKHLSTKIDGKIDMIKNAIIEECLSSLTPVKNKVEGVAEVYYSLVRNYEFLNSSYEELKEMFKDYISKVENSQTTIPGSGTEKNIDSVTNYYLSTSSNSEVTIETDGWSDSMQTLTADKKYLWNYEVTTYTDGTSETTMKPRIIGVYQE